MSFVLDPRIAADSLEVGDLALSRLRLMNDARYPWFVLAPRRVDAVEIIDLDVEDRRLLIEEIAAVAAYIKTAFAPAKVNIGALGNIVRQLHVHVVARRVGDAAWPGPVWGQGSARPYERDEGLDLAARARAVLGAI